MDGRTRDAKELFLDGLELDEDGRVALLAELRARDAPLAERVASLFAAHERAERARTDDLDRVGARAVRASAVDSDAVAGARIDDYVLEREIGSGGFGSVWLATQEGPIQRRVALKILKAGMDTREVVARFEAERQALARMDHPGIARIHAAGSTATGRPYFAMEYVEGQPIGVHCDARELDTGARLRVFARVCRAIGHAHTKGVVHRDIKPSNVLVDADGAPRVIDFGIAKALRGDLTDGTPNTGLDQIMGTPAYMAPEQVRGGSDVDTRTDVYGLGGLLYELLTGAPPLDVRAAANAGVDAVRRSVRESVPVRPSSRIEAAERGDGANAVRSPVRAAEVRGDLDWIALRCLEKDPELRYESVAVLANEIERHLAGQPVLAGPPTLGYRLSKFAQRNARVLVALGAVFVGLLIAIAVIDGEARRAKDAERVARESESVARAELVRANAAADFLEDLLMSVDPAVARGRDATLLLEMLARSAVRVEDVSQGLPLVEAKLRRVIGGAYLALARFEEAHVNLERAWTLRRDALGVDHPDTLASANELWPALAEVGRIDEALELGRRTLERSRAVLGESNERTLTCASNIGVLLSGLRRHDEAIAVLEPLVHVHTERFGPNDDDTITVRNNLAEALSAVGRNAEARAHFEAAYRHQLATRGAQAPRTLAAANNYAGVLADLGEDESVVALLEEVLTAKREVFEDGHPSLVVGLNNLASARAKAGQDLAAEEVHREAVSMAREHLGLESRYTLVAVHNFAQFLGERDRHAEATDLWRSLIEPGAAVFGDGSEFHLSACRGLAHSLYARRVELDEAEALLAEVLQRRRASDSDARDVDALRARVQLVRGVRGDAEARSALRELVPVLRGHGLDDLALEVEGVLAEAGDPPR